MDMSEIWGWLRPTLELTMAIAIFIAAFFFFLAVIGKNNARRSGIVSGLAAILAFVLLVFTAAGNIYWTVPNPNPKLGISNFRFFCYSSAWELSSLISLLMPEKLLNTRRPVIPPYSWQ